MRTESKARELFIDTFTTITTCPPHESFTLILSTDDTLESPKIQLAIFETERLLTGIELPRRFWREYSDDVFRAGITLELVNYFHFEPSIIEHDMLVEIAEVRTKHPRGSTAVQKAIQDIRYKYEVISGGLQAELARKLTGDALVFEWFAKANYCPGWLVDFCRQMISEVQEFTFPVRRRQPRIEAFRLRIRHFQLLATGKNDEAEKLRTEQSARVAAILADYKTPSSV